jgi:23S rRNA (uracil1939-C5)-methyltransferase
MNNGLKNLLLRMKNYGEIFENVEIIDMASEGKCVARHNERVIFVTHVAPGDIVDVKIIGRDKKFLEAVPIHFHKYSSVRAEAFCSHFGTCGGCKWQHIGYETQLFYKQKQVKDALERIGKVELPEIQSILGSEQTQYYRNKLEYTFSNKRWLEKEEIGSVTDTNALGFHIPGRFDKILDIQHCYHQAEPSNEIRNELSAFAQANEISFFDLKRQEGLLRNLIIRLSSTGELMVIVQFFYYEGETIQKVMNFLKDKFPQITSLLYIVNSKGNDTIHDQDVITFHGKDHIMEAMEDLKFRIGPKSFYQTNSKQAFELYKVVAEYADIQPSDVVYDLYTGTGTIANFVARKAKKVVGVEYVPSAIEDAKINSGINGIKNAVFYAGDMAKVLNEKFVANNDQPDVVITDPPRAGMADDVVKMLLRIAPQRIVYVSCNPATQARDLALLDAKYKVLGVQPVDMFPHTHHVENVVKLELKPL